jgi:hypothetical protein
MLRGMLSRIKQWIQNPCKEPTLAFSDSETPLHSAVWSQSELGWDAFCHGHIKKQWESNRLQEGTGVVKSVIRFYPGGEG